MFLALLYLTACSSVGLSGVDGDWIGRVTLDGEIYKANLRIGPLADSQGRRSSSLTIQTLGEFVPYCRLDSSLKCFCACNKYGLNMEGSVRGSTWSGEITLKEDSSSAQTGVFELEKK